MPRSVVEVWRETENHRGEGLIVDQHIALLPGCGVLLRQQKNNKGLADTLSAGLEKSHFKRQVQPSVLQLPPATLSRPGCLNESCWATTRIAAQKTFAPRNCGSAHNIKSTRRIGSHKLGLSARASTVTRKRRMRRGKGERWRRFAARRCRAMPRTRCEATRRRPRLAHPRLNSRRVLGPTVSVCTRCTGRLPALAGCANT